VRDLTCASFVFQVKSVLKLSQEYKLAVRIILAAKAHDQADAVRQMELAAYTTHCSLEPPHLMLACNLAMTVTYKHSNFIQAAGFARRLLEMPDINSAKNAPLAAKVRCGIFCLSSKNYVPCLPFAMYYRPKKCCNSVSSRLAIRIKLTMMS
jgi:hypothetical protein